MTEHRIGTQEEWQAERDELLKAEKELTRRGDELAGKRRELPWVAVVRVTARGLESAMAYYALLDRTPRGRDESDTRPLWLRRHDEYETS